MTDQSTQGNTLSAPHFHASAIQLVVTENEIVLVLGQVQPTVTDAGEFGPPMSSPVAILHLSPQTLADLAKVCTDAAAGYNGSFTAVSTAFSRGETSQPQA